MAINGVFCAGTSTASTINDKPFPYNIYAVLTGSNPTYIKFNGSTKAELRGRLLFCMGVNLGRS